MGEIEELAEFLCLANINFHMLSHPPAYSLTNSPTHSPFTYSLTIHLQTHLLFKTIECLFLLTLVQTDCSAKFPVSVQSACSCHFRSHCCSFPQPTPSTPPPFLALHSCIFNSPALSSRSTLNFHSLLLLCEVSVVFKWQVLVS